MNAKTKDIEIHGVTYRLGKIDAMRGIWIRNLLEATYIENIKQSDSTPGGDNPLDSMSLEDRANATIKFVWTIAGAHLEESLYRRIQQLCLQSVQMVPPTTNVPEPIVMANGSFAATAQGLASDGPALDRIITESLQFNLSRFFVPDASTSSQQPDLSLSNASR